MSRSSNARIAVSCSYVALFELNIKLLGRREAPTFIFNKTEKRSAVEVPRPISLKVANPYQDLNVLE